MFYVVLLAPALVWERCQIDCCLIIALCYCLESRLLCERLHVARAHASLCTKALKAQGQRLLNKQQNEITGRRNFKHKGFDPLSE